MIYLANGCRYSELSVYPVDWNHPGAFISDTWIIQFRYHDPRFIKKYPRGKQCDITRGINGFGTLTTRRRKIVEVLNEWNSKLLKGYNPITHKYEDLTIKLSPPGDGEVIKQIEITTVSTELSTSNTLIPAGAPLIIIDNKVVKDRAANFKQHLIFAKEIADKFEQHHTNPEVEAGFKIQSISPNTFFIDALWLAYKTISGVKEHLGQVRSCIRAMTVAACLQELLFIPISNIGLKDLKACLHQCAKFNPRWSNYRHNKYRLYLMQLYKEICSDEAIEKDIAPDIPRKKKTRKVRILPTENERDQIDVHLRLADYNFWRFMRIFYCSGGRETELMRLQFKDIYLHKFEYKALVLKGKEYKEVLRPIPKFALPLWQELFDSVGKNLSARQVGELYVFSVGFAPGKRIIGVRNINTRWVKHVKISLGIHCEFYSLKHLYSDLVATALDLRHAQLQNSHDSPHTTSIYAVGEEARSRERLKNVDIPFSNALNSKQE